MIGVVTPGSLPETPAGVQCREHAEIDVEHDPVQPAYVERREGAVVLQPSKHALDCGMPVGSHG
jgi:hypothetical protein